MKPLKIKTTITPEGRPPYHQWVKEMRISEAAWMESEGKRRGEEIRERTGLPPRKTLWEELTE